MNKSYAIAEIKNALTVARLQVNSTATLASTNEDMAQDIATKMFDDLETIFKIYLAIDVTELAKVQCEAEVLKCESAEKSAQIEILTAKNTLLTAKLDDANARPSIEIPKEITINLGKQTLRQICRGLIAAGNLDLGKDNQNNIIEGFNKI